MQVYILKCADNSYYIGVTNNVERRLQEHQAGISKDSYTHNRRPVELVFYENFLNALSAIQFEKKIKKWTRRKKEALINGEWNKLKEYSICQNETNYLNKKSK
jgi:putative endonuclease